MNILDVAALLVFALFVLGGLYRGFLYSALSVGAYMLSWLLGLAFMPLASSAVKGSENLYGMMLYYAEGSEYVKDAELARKAISSLSADQLKSIIDDAGLPYPMGKAITHNIAVEAFSRQNISTLGDYFNQTIVSVFINILVFLLIFLIVRGILAFIINGVDYARVLPQLRSGDALLGAGLGVVRGILALFVVFMLLPVALTVLGGFDAVTELVKGSLLSSFFYRSNFLLSMMPGV
ncbi:MAG: CvpA family protein [Clostridiaceae bacterium]|nr:CvpA family protein [Eubacteriales bacterium]